MSLLCEILQQMMGVPGIIGALAYNHDGAVLGSVFPPHYQAGALQRMARLLSEDFLVQQALQGEAGGLDFRYSEGRIILRPFPQGAVLALCATEANAQLVNLALVQAVHRLARTVPEPQVPAKIPPAVAVDLVRPGALGAMKQAFMGRIGPIGEIIFTQLHEQWANGPGRGAKGLEDLVAILAKEIDDAEDQKSFLRETRTIIG